MVNDYKNDSFISQLAPQTLLYILQMTLLSGELEFTTKMIKYNCEECPDAEAHADDKERDECSMAHNRFEISFHPFKYRCSPCLSIDHTRLYSENVGLTTSGDTCYGFRIEHCPFYHNATEQRRITQKMQNES